VIAPPRSGSTEGPPPPRGGSPPPGGLLPPPPPAAGSPARRRPWGWGRLLLGALIVLLCAAGASATFVVEQVHSLSDALKQNGSFNIASNVLATASPGAPETLLLVGDDTRKGFKYYRGYVPNLANEMLLVRLDPSKPYISMMSIPRELMATIYNGNGREVYINGLPQNRLNSALSVGGSNLSAGIAALLKTIQIDLGLSVNHVVVATFYTFQRAVNEMGCVYTTVDQRYYNDNLGTPGTNYQSINLQPGYQKLCGQQALAFVSYRHTDTSLVRDARDQSFLLDVKKQYGPTLIDNATNFERIFGQAVKTDAGLQSQGEILNLLSMLVSMSSKHVRQVHFQANLQATGSNPCSCDTATQQQIKDSVDAFLYGGSPVPPAQSVTAQANAVHSGKAIAQLPLTPTAAGAQAQARAAALKLAFPLEYPAVEDRAGSFIAPTLRVYEIKAPDGNLYPAYVAVFKAGPLGQYYDVQGMTWTTAPQFDSPDQVIHVGGRSYFLYYDGSNLRMIAWYEHHAVYWVRNTLIDSLPNGEMLAIAEQTQPFAGIHATPTQPRVIHLSDAGVPTRVVPRTPLSVKQEAGGIAALITLVALPLLAFLGLRRVVQVRATRKYVLSGGERGRRPAGPRGLTGLPLERDPLAGLGRLGGLGRPALAGAAGGGGMGGGGAGGAAGSWPGRPSAASGRWLGSPTVYRESALRRPAAIAALLAVLAVAAGGAAAAVILTRHHHPPVVRRVRRSVIPVLPTAPVVVLNATQTPDAAHRLALALEAKHVKVAGVGNLSQTLPPGDQIQYAPGDRGQAELLAHLLGLPATALAPLDPEVSAAAGSNPQVVVVIT
jgi:LCP family protein required for cell wall assembly